MTEFFEEKDTELLLGAAIETERVCDTNLGRSMDKIFETGTQKIFSQLAQNALTVFAVDPRRLHVNTTSVNVFGDYDLVDTPFDITYGHSKDKRPDLKQFLVSMLVPGPLAEEHDRPKRPPARYRAYDGTVELYGKT